MVCINLYEKGHNFQKSFTGNWNQKMETGHGSFGRVSGYPAG